MNGCSGEPSARAAGFLLAMKHQKHTLLSATAAIAAVLAFSATPLAAQSVDPAPAAPTMQAEPAAPPAATAPAPAISLPDAGAASDASPAPAPDPAPSMAPAATGASESVTPVRQTSRHSTVTRTTTVTRTAPAAVAAPAVVPAAAPVIAPAAAGTTPPAADLAPVAAPPPSPAPEPTPTQSQNVVGMMGVVLLALLALAILAAGLLFFRRRHPAVAVATTDSEPVVTEDAYVPVAEPVAATPPASASMHRLRDANPVRGALPSDGAAVDLPARLPEAHEERAALFERMVDARPDKANPFTERHARARRARLIMQSLGRTFDREPLIDLSQYPNNWPELARQYHKAA